jgi:hypothetical protein
MRSGEAEVGERAVAVGVDHRRCPTRLDRLGELEVALGHGWSIFVSIAPVAGAGVRHAAAPADAYCEMLLFTLIVLAVILVPVVAGGVAWALLEPRDAWWGLMESAAAAAAVTGGLLVVASLAGMLPSLDPAGRAEATSRLIVIALASVPIFGLALSGAAIGRAVGRSGTALGGTGTARDRR